MTKEERVLKVVHLLETDFGIPRWQGRGNPLSSLVKTILSQSTNDLNRDRAYDSLRRIFPSWEDVMNAKRRDVADAIRIAGLANQKSGRIQDILQWIFDNYGSLNLDFICEKEPKEVIQTFMQLKGIGIKTISVVLMFTCGVDIFPVDTHVHRICRRIGLVPGNASAEKTHWLMQPLVPKGKAYSLHINLLKLGRTICKARNPKCNECPVVSVCDYGKNAFQSMEQYFPYTTAPRTQSNI